MDPWALLAVQKQADQKLRAFLEEHIKELISDRPLGQAVDNNDALSSSQSSSGGAAPGGPTSKTRYQLRQQRGDTP